MSDLSNDILELSKAAGIDVLTTTEGNTYTVKPTAKRAGASKKWLGGEENLEVRTLKVDKASESAMSTR